jgi:vacuolar-type H+-ATPase subunit H
MEAVLQAERDAARAVEQCERDAHRILQEAGERARRILARADARVTLVQVRCRQRLDGELRALHRRVPERADTSTTSGAENAAIEAAIEALAAELTGVAAAGRDQG